jgi:hypothetical protein
VAAVSFVLRAAVLVWLVCLTAAIGIGINRVAPIPNPLHFPEKVGRAAASLLLILILVRAERVGLRRWLAGWFAEAPGHHGHRHHHGHGHAHAHSSEMPNGSAVTKRSPDASGPSAEA